MTDLLTRTNPGIDLEVRTSAGGRTIAGIAVPYDVPTSVNDGFGIYQELFRAGAFSKTIAERMDKVKLLALHDKRSLPLGRATLLREDALGLYGEFYVSATQAGDEVLELVRDGALDAFSIGFKPIKDRQKGSLVERLEVALHEVSLVAFPAYEGAKVLSVRQDEQSAPSGLALADAQERLKALTK